jgi:hypothetical protein
MNSAVPSPTIEETAHIRIPLTMLSPGIEGVMTKPKRVDHEAGPSQEQLPTEHIVSNVGGALFRWCVVANPACGGFRYHHPSGAVVPGVSVAIVSQGTGLKRSALTDSAGEYSFAGLPFEWYVVCISLCAKELVAKGYSKNSTLPERAGGIAV